MIHWLSAPEDVDTRAWDGYLAAARDSMRASWNRTLSAYRTLRSVREGFGLPLVVPPTESGAVQGGALTQSQQQSFLELAAMVGTASKAVDDAIAGRRKVGYDETTRNLQIERLPSDINRVEMQNDRPVLIENATGQTPVITGTIDGALGIAPIVWVGLGVAGVVVTVGVIYAVTEVSDDARQIIHDDVLKTLATQQHERVMSGKATPEQSKQMSDAILKGEADLERAKTETQRTAGLSLDTAKTIRVVAYVGLGAAAIYLATKLVPQRAAATA